MLEGIRSGIRLIRSRCRSRGVQGDIITLERWDLCGLEIRVRRPISRMSISCLGAMNSKMSKIIMKLHQMIRLRIKRPTILGPQVLALGMIPWLGQ